MIETAYWHELLETVPSAEDLENLTRAIVREKVIRATMSTTGENREVVTLMVDSLESMSQESVLSLTDGDPTTLRDALQLYVDRLEVDSTSSYADVVADELTSLLRYPWTEDEERLELHKPNGSTRLTVDRPDDDHVTVTLGGREVYSGSYDSLGWSGMKAVEEVSQALHRAVLARVIPDRDHMVQINASGTADLRTWLERPNGSVILDKRLSLNAVEDGGILVRTNPYRYSPPSS